MEYNTDQVIAIGDKNTARFITENIAHELASFGLYASCIMGSYLLSGILRSLGIAHYITTGIITYRINHVKYDQYNIWVTIDGSNYDVARRVAEILTQTKFNYSYNNKITRPLSKEEQELQWLLDCTQGDLEGYWSRAPPNVFEIALHINEVVYASLYRG